MTFFLFTVWYCLGNRLLVLKLNLKLISSRNRLSFTYLNQICSLNVSYIGKAKLFLIWRKASVGHMIVWFHCHVFHFYLRIHPVYWFCTKKRPRTGRIQDWNYMSIFLTFTNISNDSICSYFIVLDSKTFTILIKLDTPTPDEFHL